jgi:two-component system cell cycle response regulator
MARILVAEDNPENLELMVYLLESFGHTTMSATDGQRCLDRVADELPDLVVLDLEMPVLDGFETAAALRADPRTRGIPIVAVTAYAMLGDRDRVLGAGFDGYFTKPIDPTSFVPSLERLLATPESARSDEAR